MSASEPHANLPINLDTKHCTLSPAEQQALQHEISVLAHQVERFPITALHVLIEYYERSNQYQVKTSLVLTGETLVSMDVDEQMHPALERCVANLMEDVRAYKERLGHTTEQAKQEKGTHQELRPTLNPDPEAMDAAVAAGDFAAFRTATFAYEEPVRKRIGRWLERYPEINAQVDHGLKIADLVEEVFLNAFEKYEHRPQEIRFGDWLESLIDPAVKVLRANKDGELENINLVRSARAAEQGPEAV